MGKAATIPVTIARLEMALRDLDRLNQTVAAAFVQQAIAILEAAVAGNQHLLPDRDQE